MKAEQPNSAASCGDQLIDVMHELIKEQTAFQERCLQTQSDILAQLSALKSQSTTSVHLPKIPEDCPRLPVESAEEMWELNAYLQDVEKFEKMAEYLRQIGGLDEKATVRNILCVLISNNLAMKCSWLGSKGTKEAVSKQANILAVILAALKPKYGTADKTTVAAVVKKWVYCSGDRDGGRSERRQKEGP